MDEFIKYLSKEYEVRPETIKNYCQLMLTYPFVRENTDKFEECLEMIVSDRISLLKGELVTGAKATVDKWISKFYSDEIESYNIIRDKDYYDDTYSADNIKFQ